jgi:hypothetical protein
MIARPLVYLRSLYAPLEADEILQSAWCTLEHFPVKQSQVQPLYMTVQWKNSTDYINYFDLEA